MFLIKNINKISQQYRIWYSEKKQGVKSPEEKICYIKNNLKNSASLKDISRSRSFVFMEEKFDTLCA